MKAEKICGFDHSVSLSVSKTSIKIYRAGGKSRDWCFLSPAWCCRGLFLSGCRGQDCLLGTLVALCRREGGKRKSGTQQHTRTHRHISSTLKRNSMPAPVDICFHRCAHPMWLRLALHTHRAMLRWCANTGCWGISVRRKEQLCCLGADGNDDESLKRRKQVKEKTRGMEEASYARKFIRLIYCKLFTDTSLRKTGIIWRTCRLSSAVWYSKENGEITWKDWSKPHMGIVFFFFFF